MTLPRPRTVLASVVVVMLVTAALPPGVLGNHGDGTVDWPDGPTRAFYSDDPDENVTDDNGNTSLVNVTDVYYRSTTPSFTADGTTLAEYRRQQLRSVERTDDDSKYLPFSDLESGAGGVIEDAHVTLLGVVGGGRPVVDGTDAPLYVPADGQVLNYLDYRVDESEVPDDYTEEVNENVTKRHSYTFEGHEVGDRVVRVNGREVGRKSGRPDARIIEYDDARESGTVSLTVRATITVRIEHEIETIEEVGNVTNRSTRSTTITKQVTVSDSMEVNVVGDQSVQLRQRLVDVEGHTADRLVVSVEGPAVDESESLQRRQLWSTLAFGEPSVVVNNWGVYSTTQYAHGYVATEDDDDGRPYDFPHVLGVKFTSSTAEPYASTNISADAVSAMPQVRTVEQSNYTSATPPLGPWVNLTTTRPTFVHQFTVEDPPGNATSATGLFGRNVSLVNETPITVEETEVEVTKVNESHAKVRLFDPDTGDGIAGRTLDLSGAARKSVTTNESGVVLVNRTSRILRASFDDRWREDLRNGNLNPDQTYYKSDEDDLLVVELSLLYTELLDVIRGFLLASPFILGWVWIRSMDTMM